uniref:MIF4G domain containing a n=1 Tax=Eptatretus burgeri TaxID=7764 RepID=A0A8C4Q4W3_EPTBU
MAISMVIFSFWLRAMQDKDQDVHLQAFDKETQNMLKDALKDPDTVDLRKVAAVIINQSLQDPVFCKEACRVCRVIIQAEAKGDNNTFRGHLLNLLQEEYARREETRENDHKRWIGFVSLICSVFHNIKVGSGPMIALVEPIYECLNRMTKFDAVTHEEEVYCLVEQLHRIGKQLENQNETQMSELFCTLRDCFFIESLTSLSRLLLLNIIEFRAGGWEFGHILTRFFLDHMRPSLRTRAFLLPTLHSPSYLIFWLPHPHPLHASLVTPINPLSRHGLLTQNLGR